MAKSSLVYVCDFETTSYEGQTNTEVWAAACVKLYTEDVKIFNSIDKFIWYIINLGRNSKLYFHNLKFDGFFIISWLMNNDFKQGGQYEGDGNNKTWTWKKDNELDHREFKYLISDEGSWYSITIQYHDYKITIWDSLKLIPYSVKKIGDAFKTKHKKTSIEYTGFRKANGFITEQEKEYIANDVLVVKEAVEYMYNRDHQKMTIGSCCLQEFKSKTMDYAEIFPDLTKIPLDYRLFGSNTADEYIRKAYGGGWCYLVTEKACKVLGKGCTADVNSLYPSRMHSESGCAYPIGLPQFVRGNIERNRYYIVDHPDYYYYLRIRCNFFLKEGKLPFIHIRNKPWYHANENLKTNYVYRDGKYYDKIKFFGEWIDLKAELTLSCVDWKLFKEHYDIYDLEFLDGCYFTTYPGVFDFYINQYRELKENAQSEGERTIAKLFLNNLYGKLAASSDSDYKTCYLDENGIIKFESWESHDKKAGHIGAGAAITSYARDFTIRAAQANYHGPDKPGFVYADTDSIHCDMSVLEIRGIKIDSKKFNHWKIESEWDSAVFARQKTYIEIIQNPDATSNDLWEKYKWDVKCAGMGRECKELFIDSVTGRRRDIIYSPQALEFLDQKLGLKDFKPGLVVPGKLIPHRMPGGIVLQEGYYTMKRMF